MNSHKKIILWLMISAAMVFAMAIIGAITRLTGSGLSMAEWRPLIGFIPPLCETEWERVFNLYSQTPEYIHKNSWMEIEEFKKIFFWEWLHRVWGRLIGIVFAVPLILFAVTKTIPRGYGLKLLGLLLLGGSQGLIGWWMVKSGLVDKPDVSHFRLAAHLGVAFLIYGIMIWFICDLRHRYGKTMYIHPMHRRAALPGIIALLMTALTITWGAFVAGLDAGLVYNAFPHMSANADSIEFLPDADFAALAVIHDHGWVQFTHRWLAIFTALIVLGFAWIARSYALAFMVLVQVGLGIATLLSQVMIPLAALHQAGAFIVLTILLTSLHRVRHSPAQ